MIDDCLPQSCVSCFSKADLQALAPKLNPVVPFFDPLKLADAVFWGKSETLTGEVSGLFLPGDIWGGYDASNEATIGWLRHSEIKHGRVAMAAFVGYCAQANGVRFPWPMTMDGSPFPEAGLSPEAQWDAIPIGAKWQVIALVAFLELWGESGAENHYMKGGKPGYFPPFKGNSVQELPHPVPLNLFDPFGLSKNKSAESKAKGLLAEINNGRLAMIGIFGFISESKVAGSVPALTGLIKPYDGDVMAPFAANFHF
jgi:hypothetical protein